MENGGIKQLGKEDQAAANELFDRLRHYGIFAVRNGEVESWLPELGIGSKKAAGAVQMLERLGSDQRFPPFLQRVKGDKNLRFILTSRDYILHRAQAQSARLSVPGVRASELILNVGRYSDLASVCSIRRVVEL
jgi:hypothetical protein